MQAEDGSTHPAPFVTQPAKKVLQSELDVKVFAAWEHCLTAQTDVEVAPTVG